MHNLLAALLGLRPGDAAPVTLDADTLPPPDLLAELLRPVLTGQGEISSGYRWTPPAASGAGSPLRSLAKMGVATLPRDARINLCRGGATAIGRRALDRLGLLSLWDRAMSDDLSSSRAAGLVIHAPPTARLPSSVAAGIGGALRFGRASTRRGAGCSLGRYSRSRRPAARRRSPGRWPGAAPRWPAWPPLGCCNASAPLCAAPLRDAFSLPAPPPKRRGRCAARGGGRIRPAPPRLDRQRMGTAPRLGGVTLPALGLRRRADGGAPARGRRPVT